ncbi:N-acetylmuramoyl-L-alanine amidase [Niabella drilacis]|uniref:N-acetylmuramoyl-L-alanine amidase n=1 Tax=Niabella drilacis (strain DSM 25811 / CCM 8410 / CCUG 62505 / LMG 26954 / E90) TaxID=1285928 RepID=A0A1G6Q3V6_NIADE|nr:N-acetylmuramoyl-L-alanine amidase [Niabella drilacis]SDC87142.1 N-acetyl-anhydromuramyl-L-alanine amidase AmpD [Niabella drilacis]
MLSSKALFRMALLMVVLYACGTSQPARRNVLSKTSPPANQQPAENNGRNPGQTTFTKPEQITRQQQKTEETRKVNTAVERRQEEAATVTAAEAKAAGYRSPAYYRYITDSIQQTSAKSAYYKTTENLFKQMAVVPNPQNPAINSRWYTTVNFDNRKPNFVILHHTAQDNTEQTLFTFSVTRTGVSAHFVVGKDGITYQMLNEYFRAWHAGKSKWGAVTDMNSCSIGIEIDNNGKEPFPEAQISALLKLLDYLKDKFGIPQANFIAHSDIAPVRKNDPSKYFPWKRLADAGFGYWYDSANLAEPPADFNALLALRVIGYNTAIPADAIQAFKLHFIQNDSSPMLTDYDKKVLYNVYKYY